MVKPFLKAHWSHLCIVSYAVPRGLLEKRLPPGVALDLKDGEAFVSLVAFDFEHVRVRGIAWPGYRAFPEVNLRFYVKRGEDRGVCFVKELVPKRMIAWVARSAYNEPYEVAKRMESKVERVADGLTVQHRFCVADHVQTLAVGATSEAPLLPPDGGVETWFTQRAWGFGRGKNGLPTSYRVVHPKWLVHHVQWSEVKVNFARVYGPEWKDLSHAKPASVILAEGSEVAVFPC